MNYGQGVWLLHLVNVTVPGPDETLLPAVFAYARRPWCTLKRGGKKSMVTVRYKVGMVVVARCTCQPPDDSDGHQPRYVIEMVPSNFYHVRYGILLRNIATGRRHRTSVRTLDREYLLAEVRDL